MNSATKDLSGLELAGLGVWGCSGFLTSGLKMLEVGVSCFAVEV